MSINRTHVAKANELRMISVCLSILMFEDIQGKKRYPQTVPASLSLTSLGKSLEETADSLKETRTGIWEKYVEKDEKSEDGFKRTKHEKEEDRKLVFKKDVENAEELFEKELEELDNSLVELNYRPCPTDAFPGRELDPLVVSTLDFMFE